MKRNSLLMVIVLVLSCSERGQSEDHPQATPEEVAAARKARQEGSRHLQQRRYFGAIPRFDEALRLNPDDLESFVARCKAYRAINPFAFKLPFGSGSKPGSTPWLSRHVQPDGGWAFANKAGQERDFANPGTDRSRVRASVLVVLAYVGAGQYFDRAKRGEIFRSGIRFLGSEMEIGPKGVDARGKHGDMVSHALTTTVFCGLFHLRHDRQLRAPAQAMVNFIQHTQDSETGGWGLQPGRKGDTVATGWQMMAMESARRAGLRVSEETLRKTAGFLDRVQSENGAYYGRTEPGREPTATAMGLLSRLYLGWKPDREEVRRGLAYLHQTGPSTKDVQFTFVSTVLMKQCATEDWKPWNVAVRDLIVEAQDKEGPEAGSWFDADEAGAARGGRLYQTTLNTMTLEVYYEYLPLYAPRSDLDGHSRSPWAAEPPDSAPSEILADQRVSVTEEGLAVDVGGGVNMEFVRISPGEFIMGQHRVYDISPEHHVRITKPFYMGKFEVTEQQWEAVVEGNTSGFEDAKHPIESVSWHDCQAFLGKLNERFRGTCREFRLPTEAEWEYVCRAGTRTRWSFGDDETKLKEYARSPDEHSSQTYPVGQKKPNPWGLFGMHGNVYEWCHDWHGRYFYEVSPVNDPAGPVVGSYRVFRGGTNHGSRHGQSANREGHRPNVRWYELGFRVVSTPADKQPTDVKLRIKPVPQQTLTVGEDLIVGVELEDARFWARNVRYALGSPTPSGAGIDAKTGVLTWVPTAPATYVFIVKVTSTGASSQQAWTKFTARVLPGREVAPVQREISVDLGGGVDMELVLIPAGEFLMGSPRGEGDTQEHPQHRVKITRPFYMGRYEVTQQQWEAVTGDNPSVFEDEKNLVERVDWNDCTAFLKKLNEKHGVKGRKFALPSEAQWEYACRARTSTVWYFGNDKNLRHEYGWFAGRGLFGAQAVGQKKPNAWGLFDMHGNVKEWCSDWYSAEYYGVSPASDPRGPTTGSRRVARGGCWIYLPGDSRSANRLEYLPTYSNFHLGLRLVLRPRQSSTSDRRDVEKEGGQRGKLL